MRTNMWVRIICAILTLMAFGGAIFFEYCHKETFLCNICLALFGSALLAYITAFVSYKGVQRESIMRYLSDLRHYRKKYRCVRAAGKDNIDAYLEDLSDCFDELSYDYAQIQYLCKGRFIHRDISRKLDNSFQNILDVQRKLNIANFDFLQYQQKIDDAIKLGESVAQKKGYLQRRK